MYAVTKARSATGPEARQTVGDNLLHGQQRRSDTNRTVVDEDDYKTSSMSSSGLFSRRNLVRFLRVYCLVVGSDRNRLQPEPV